MQKKNLVRNALIVGISQGIACFNGISRSGATTSTMRMLGLSNDDSANICFILSIPIIIGSSAVELLTTNPLSNINVLPLLLAMAVSFTSGFFAVKTFIKILKKQKLWIFSIYTLLLAIASFFIVSK